MYKKLLSDSAVYGLGGILIKAIAFFTLPIYTKIFTPEQYGIIEMFSTIGGILSIFMTMGLDSAQSYYFMEAKNKKTYDIKEITTSILGLRIVLGIGVIGIVSIFAPFILNFAFDTKLPVIYLVIVASSIFFANLISQSLEIFRLIYKPWHYIGLSFIQTIFNIGFILYFAYFLKMDIYGYLLGNLIASFIVMFLGWIATKDYRYFKSLRIDLWKEFLKFGVPLVPAGFAIWIMQASDRWFVMKMLSSYELGIYAVGAKFAMLIALAVEVFRKAWWPIAMDMLHKPQGSEFIRKISFWYILLGSVATVILALIAPYLVKYLVDEKYYESYKIIGVLGWSGVFYGFYLISELGIFKSKKTYYSILTNFIGAVLNMILNYFLIKLYGLIGAAYATIISLMVANIIGMNISNKFLYVKWQWIYYAIFIFLSLGIILYLGRIR